MAQTSTEQNLKPSSGTLAFVSATIIVILVPLIVFAAALKFQLQPGGQFEETSKTFITDVARDTAAVINSALEGIIKDAFVIAAIPSVRETASVGSDQAYDRPSVEAIDREWQENNEVPADLAVNPLEIAVSEYFKEIASGHRVFREIILADNRGRLVAASGLTSDYDQSDEDWWSRTNIDTETCSSNPLRCATLGEVEWDESARTFGFSVSVPVTDRDQRNAGVLKVVIEADIISRILRALRVTQAFQSALIRRDDGVVVVTADKTRAPVGKVFFAFTDLERERNNAINEYCRAWVEDETQRNLLACSPLDRRAQSWMVVVWQHETNLLGPLYRKIWSLALMLAMLSIVIEAAAIYLYWRRAVARGAGGV